MSTHVLLNLLNELGNEFNKFNNTRARMLDSIYHMTNTLKSHFWRKNVILLSLCTQRCYGRHNVSRESINTSGFSILLHGVISLPDATSYDKCCNKNVMLIKVSKGAKIRNRYNQVPS